MRVAWQHGANAAAAEPSVVGLMDPVVSIAATETASAKQWRILHGAAERDSSRAMPWGQGHGGDHDLGEPFAWIEGVCR